MTSRTSVGSFNGVRIFGGDMLRLGVMSSRVECSSVQVLASGERQQGMNWVIKTPLLGVGDVEGEEVGWWVGPVPGRGDARDGG